MATQFLLKAAGRTCIKWLQLIQRINGTMGQSSVFCVPWINIPEVRRMLSGHQETAG